VTVPASSHLLLPDPEPASQPFGAVRASDADRERAIDVLSQAFAEGRLSTEEHEMRVEQAYAARTSAELLAVSADLPAGPPAAAPAPGPSDGTHRPAVAAGRRTNSLAVAALVCSMIPGLPQFAAIIMGIAALRQVRRTGERGTALAVAALTLAVLGPVLAVLLFVW
jgi:DUF1707 SHOCT-like domain/Domain of unknown function (DUF4190)